MISTNVKDVHAFMVEVARKEETYIKQIPYCMSCHKSTPDDKDKLITDKWTVIRQKIEPKVSIAPFNSTYNYTTKNELDLSSFLDSQIIGLQCANCSGLNKNIWWERI